MSNFILLRRFVGVAVAYLRLSRLAEFISEDGLTAADFEVAALRRSNPHVTELKFESGKYSPVNSWSLGPVAVRMLAGHPDSSDPEALVTAIDLLVAQERVIEFREHKKGVDEVLSGRTGVVALIAELYTREFDEPTNKKMKAVYGATPKLVEAIIQSGKVGAEEFRRAGGDDDFPLLWSWIDGYYGLGA